MPGIRRLGRDAACATWIPTGAPVLTARCWPAIKSLACRPPGPNVWICPDPRGHVQATGRDARGRKQYRYHPRWREVRDEVKYGRLLEFARGAARTA